ncbi:TIGR02678 family protein [Acetobacterium wieringae]|uniref:TIGR02678 family protein n=1 Tax=Acetobacterium wieringae TaxID=52694 RepID=A0A5D0WTR9_9FIRM|nr:TIGR02678 family protein [Acetobacterium wieringae]TYC87594.1 TIGR02678 family protein [Acetobacterium wieringae]
MKELELLLDHYWVVKDDDKDVFYRVKDSIPEFKSFLNEKLGYGIIINQYLIKLEKIPGSAESFMGIQEFNHPREYVLLCLLLMFLEDRSRDEQFVLSEITEFIAGNNIGKEKIDWTQYSHRKHFIKVLRFAQTLGLMKVNDGDDQKFAYHDDAEVLYESTGLSRYFVRHFTADIMGFANYLDMENAEWGDLNADRGVIRRQRVYRKLLMEPVVYSQGTEDVDYDYIKKQRGLMEADFSKYLEYSLHVHKNGAMLVVPAEKNIQDGFPNTKAICDITLLLVAQIRESLSEKKLQINPAGGITLSRVAFDEQVAVLKEKTGNNWSKEFREMSPVGLAEKLVAYLEEFKMLRQLYDGREIEILPLAGKLMGSYPEAVTKGSGEN